MSSCDLPSQPSIIIFHSHICLRRELGNVLTGAEICVVLSNVKRKRRLMQTFCICVHLSPSPMISYLSPIQYLLDEKPSLSAVESPVQSLPPTNNKLEGIISAVFYPFFEQSRDNSTLALFGLQSNELQSTYDRQMSQPSLLNVEHASRCWRGVWLLFKKVLFQSRLDSLLFLNGVMIILSPGPY